MSSMCLQWLKELQKEIHIKSMATFIPLAKLTSPKVSENCGLSLTEFGKWSVKRSKYLYVIHKSLKAKGYWKIEIKYQAKKFVLKMNSILI